MNNSRCKTKGYSCKKKNEWRDTHSPGTKDINIRTFKNLRIYNWIVKESVSNNLEGKYLPFPIKRFKLNKQLCGWRS
jgi:hypothetical protein